MSSAILRLKIPVKVTYIFVLCDLVRSVFLLKDVVDFDFGGLDFGSPSLASMPVDSVPLQMYPGYHFNSIRIFGTAQVSINDCAATSRYYLVRFLADKAASCGSASVLQEPAAFGIERLRTSAASAFAISASPWTPHVAPLHVDCATHFAVFSSFLPGGGVFRSVGTRNLESFLSGGGIDAFLHA